MADTIDIPNVNVLTELKIATWQEANQDYMAQYQEVLKIQQVLKQELRTLQYMKPRLHHTMNLVARSSPETISPEGKVEALDKLEQEVIHMSNKLLDDVCELVELEAKVLRHFDKKRGEEFVNGFLGRLDTMMGKAGNALDHKFGGVVLVEDGERDPWLEYANRDKTKEMVVDQIFNTVKEIVDDDYSWLEDSVREAAEDVLAELEKQERNARWENVVESENITVAVEEIGETTASTSAEYNVEMNGATKEKEKAAEDDQNVITVLHITKKPDSKPYVTEHYRAKEVKDKVANSEAKIESAIQEKDANLKKDDNLVAAIIVAKEMDTGLFGAEEARAEKEVKEFSESLDLYSSEDNDFEDPLKA